MSTPTVLPASALARLTLAGTPPAGRYAAAALSRAALYLLPLLLAPAATAALARLPWQLPAAALVTGWCAMTVLAARGRVVAGRSGSARSARQVLAGFLVVAAGWSASLALINAAPAWLPAGLRELAADPVTGYAVTGSVLALAAAVATGAATGMEPMVLRWSLPLAVVAVAIASGRLSELGQLHPSLGQLPAALLLPAGIAVPLLRLGLLAWDPRRRHRNAQPADDPAWAERFDRADLRTSACYLAFGAAQAGLVVTAWQLTRPAVADGGLPPSVVPLLLTLPVVQLWLGWHVHRVTVGPGRADRAAHQRYVHRVAWGTLGALLPALVAGVALLAAAPRLPYGLSHHPDPPGLVHALATGVLLAGLMALGSLLAARARPGLAALVVGAPLLATPALTAGPLVSGALLAALPAALAAAYALGLVVAANLLFDPAPAPAAPAPGSPAEAAR